MGSVQAVGRVQAVGGSLAPILASLPGRTHATSRQPRPQATNKQPSMASTPVSIPTNTTDDETLLRVTRSGALFGVPPVLMPEGESSPDIPPQVERASSAPCEVAQVYVNDVTPEGTSPSDCDNPDTPHGDVNRPAPIEAPRQPEVVEPPPETQEPSGLGQLASVLERMMSAQAEQQGKLLERVLALTNKPSDDNPKDKNNEKHYTRGTLDPVTTQGVVYKRGL